MSPEMSESAKNWLAGASRWADPPNSIRIPMEEAERERKRRESLGLGLRIVRATKNLDPETFATRLSMSVEEFSECEAGQKPCPPVEELTTWNRQLGLTDDEGLTLKAYGGYKLTPEEDRKVLINGLIGLQEVQKRMPKLGLFQKARIALKIKLDELRRPLK